MSLPQIAVDANSISKQTVATRLTSAGASAVAVIALRGPKTHEFLQRGFRSASAQPIESGQVRFGRWVSREHESKSPEVGAEPEHSLTAEAIVVTPLDNDHVEIHCHGGDAAADRILDDLQQLGAQRIPSSQWVGSDALLIDEAQQVLSRCHTERMAAIALDHVRGALCEWVDRSLTELSRLDAPTALKTTDRVRQQASEIAGFAAFGLRLADPMSVVLFGPPNVGKSTLMNAILGYSRSITHDLAGTTRDLLHAETVIDGFPIRMTDTAGIRFSDDSIERQGVSRAREALLTADLVIFVSEPGQTADQRVESTGAPRLSVLNKRDLLESGPVDDDSQPIATNALTGEGVDLLMQRIAEVLSNRLPPPRSPMPLNERQATILNELATSTDAAHARRLLHRLATGKDE